MLVCMFEALCTEDDKLQPCGDAAVQLASAFFFTLVRVCAPKSVCGGPRRPPYLVGCSIALFIVDAE